MPLSAYLAFVAASVALVLLPGPNVAMIVGTTLKHGRRAGFATVAGTSAASILQLAALCWGFAIILAQAGAAFAILRWAGVAYLLVLGIRAWRAPARPLEARSGARSGRKAFASGFAVALTNPKTLLFYGAFLPQFVDRNGDEGAQFVLLSASFVVIATSLDCGWTLLAGRLRSVLDLWPRLRNRITGGALIGAAAGLALVNRS